MESNDEMVKHDVLGMLASFRATRSRGLAAGKAAVGIGGCTIHSFAGIGLGIDVGVSLQGIAPFLPLPSGAAVVRVCVCCVVCVASAFFVPSYVFFDNTTEGPSLRFASNPSFPTVLCAPPVISKARE